MKLNLVPESNRELSLGESNPLVLTPISEKLSGNRHYGILTILVQRST